MRTQGGETEGGFKFWTWPLKVASKGQTLYQGYYGSSFRFLEGVRNGIMRCAAFAAEFRKTAIAQQLENSFNEVIADLKTITVEDTSNCLPTMAKFRRLMPPFEDTLDKFGGPGSMATQG